MKVGEKRKIISQAVNRTKFSMVENQKALFRSDLSNNDTHQYSLNPSKNPKVFNNDQYKSSIRRANDYLENQYQFNMLEESGGVDIFESKNLQVMEEEVDAEQQEDGADPFSFNLTDAGNYDSDYSQNMFARVDNTTQIKQSNFSKDSQTGLATQLPHTTSEMMLPTPSRFKKDLGNSEF